MIDVQEVDDEALASGAMTELEYMRRKVMRLEAALRDHIVITPPPGDIGG